MEVTEDITGYILCAYRDGLFPMAKSGDDEHFKLFSATRRGLLPIKNFHIPSKLLKTIANKKFSVTVNEDFEAVIDGCAASTEKRSETWINRPIRDLFVDLHHEGHAWSVESRKEDGALAGGLYGLSLGAVFCGESMFSRETDASKVALSHLVAMLWKAGFTVLDTQVINPHLLQFGAYEMPREEYKALIKTEMQKPVTLEGISPQQAMKDYLEFRNL